MDPSPRKLIEVALPLAAVNAAGRDEKAVPRKGHPATMHLWWSRKPLGVARAALFASLVDDPSARPDLYPTTAAQEAERRRLLELIEKLCRWECSDDTGLLAEAHRCIEASSGGEPPRIIDPFCGGGAIGIEAIRLGLDAFAVDLNPVAALVTTATVSIAQRFAGRPTVHPEAPEPFPHAPGPPARGLERGHRVAGGVGIGPGPPASGPVGSRGGAAGPLAGIAADLAHYGAAVEAECRRCLLGPFEAPSSPLSPGGRTEAISYLWARTITCANPACRRTTPLLSTWWLSRKPTNRWHARPVIGDGGFDFTVATGPPPADLAELKVGRGANYRCLHCGAVNDAEAVRRCGRDSGLGLRLVAVQAFADPQRRRGGRIWLAPEGRIEQAGLSAAAAVTATGDHVGHRGGHAATGLPVAAAATATAASHAAEAALHRELPTGSGNITAFGLTTFGDLLTPRQRRTMTAFATAIADMTTTVRRHALAAGMADDGVGIEDGGDGAQAYAEAITTYLALTLSRMANRTTTMTVHNRANGSVEQSFVQPAYAFYGDFPEANPFSGSTGSWSGALRYVVRALEALPAPRGVPADAPPPAGPAAAGGVRPDRSALPHVGRAQVRCDSMLTALDGFSGVVSTDPPYYDMFDYASLSNLFHVWLRATLGGIWPQTLGSLLAPTDEQIVSSAAQFGGDRAAAHAHFETLLRQAFERIGEVHDARYPITIYYGYQQAERSPKQAPGGDAAVPATAWEAMLESLIGAGLRITATWPLRTERPEGVKKGTKALASSVLLVCRPAVAETAAPASVDVGDVDGSPTTVGSATTTATVGALRRALRAELPKVLRLLQGADIAPLDLMQAAIGPGMAVYTRYERVLAADGAPLRVREVLALINEVLDETLTGAGADLDADTRWALTWFDEHGFGEGPFGGAEQLSKARNTSVAGLENAGIITTAGDRVRLRSRHELGAGWNPATDRRLTVWEVAQHLLRCLLDDGEPAAASLLGRLDADTAGAARDLAYRLYLICTRRNRTAEAAAYNGLVTSWPELTRLVSIRPTLL